MTFPEIGALLIVIIFITACTLSIAANYIWKGLKK